MDVKNKIEWKNHNFYYKFEKDENVFDPNFFSFYNGNAKEPVRLKPNITILSENELMANGPFNEGFYVIIYNRKYDYEESVISDEENKPVIPEIIVPPKPQKEFEIYENDGLLFMNKLHQNYLYEEIKLTIKVEEYTNEVYPDFPFKTYKKEIVLNKYCITDILQLQRNVIYKISFEINNQKYVQEFKAPILCYFSNVVDLKKFIKDLRLEIEIGPDDELKKLIQEKSVLLKRKFGLNENYTEDPEYFPVFKKVVNLYCVENLISLSFINGNYISSGLSGSGNGLTLSKFKVNDEGGNSDVILSVEAIKNMIKNAENDLYSSLFKKPASTNRMGVKICSYHQHLNIK